MLKKLSVLAVAFLLAACGSSNNAPETKGTATSDKDDKGNTITVEITKQGDDVKSVSIDETYEGSTKKQLGEKYGMKAGTASDPSKLGQEWDEQIKNLEDYIAKNGIDKVELDEKGYPKNEDVRTGCTINIKRIMDTVKAASDSAK